MRRTLFSIITFVFLLSALIQMTALVNPVLAVNSTQVENNSNLSNNNSLIENSNTEFSGSPTNIIPSADNTVTNKQNINTAINEQNVNTTNNQTDKPDTANKEQNISTATNQSEKQNSESEIGGASDNILRATFSTSYSTSSPNRKHNIKLATSKLNMVLYPDEVFSFNRVVGERSSERGFLSANIIMNGKFVAGIGGGVCQVSTTVYNCALLADLEILCAHRHSLPVGYVSPSFDAMVSTRSDLVFVNSTASPIRIKADADGNKITVSIYGDIMTRKIVSRSVVLKTLPYQVEEIKDSSIPLGTTLTLSKGKNGIKSNGYIDIYEENKYIATRLIRCDSYQSQKKVLAIGTKPLDVSPPHTQDNNREAEEE